MGSVYGRKDFGLYDNGNFKNGTNANFGYTYNADNPDGRGGSIEITGNGGWQGSQYIPVDTTKTYQHSVSVRTISQNGQGNNGSGHLGFACYDKNKNFIDLRNCGDIGNTTLSRAASPGDSIIYFTSSSGWYTGADVTNNRAYFRQILFFPPSHPDYSPQWQYTRLNNRSYYRMEQTAQGDWAVYLDSNTGSQTGSFNASTLPDYGYALPAGTPVSRGQAGGTYNYCHGSPVYPTTWTTYTTAPFTGESRNSGLPFRYGTKYIKFLNLRNYNYRSQGSPYATYRLSNIMFAECRNGTVFNFG
jgi:hypothetical protein